MHFNNVSQAEHTIQTEINREKPLVKGRDGRLYPKNPMNDYISHYADEFNGCLRCGSTDHRFCECSHRNDKAVRYLFWHELWAHVLSTQKKQSPTFNTTDNYKKVPLPSKPQFSYHDGIRPRLFAIFTCVSNLTSTSQKPMPISINNSLSSVHFPSGKGKENADDKMRLLVNTGVAMNSGNLYFHLWVIFQCPSIMAEYLQCGEDTEYDIVQLLAVIKLHEGSTQTNHGQMTVVIRCHTPFLVKKQHSLILSFALGKDVTLCSVLGLPSLLAIGATLNPPLGKLVCSELNFSFPLLLDPLGKDLVD